jgi:hypothetical protein
VINFARLIRYALYSIEVPADRCGMRSNQHQVALIARPHLVRGYYYISATPAIATRALSLWDICVSGNLSLDFVDDRIQITGQLIFQDKSLSIQVDHSAGARQTACHLSTMCPHIIQIDPSSRDARKLQSIKFSRAGTSRNIGWLTQWS